MQRRGFLGTVAAIFAGSMAPVEKPPVFRSTSFEAKKYIIAKIAISEELILDNSAESFIRQQMMNDIQQSMDEVMMGT